MKPLNFVGSSLADLRAFPASVRREIGVELMRVQLGGMPTNYKPLKTVGAGACEVRVQLDGAWRVFYVARFEKAVYVLHAFQKKTQRTAKSDLELAAKRYKMIGA